jgi:hypothetical protein
MRADDIPVAHTPAGGYGDEMPPPVLGGCTEPLTKGAVDMRGTWRIVSVDGKNGDWSSMVGHVQRIEQCGDRVCITAPGVQGGGPRSRWVVHDMRADGSAERGVNDVTPQGMPIVVRCTFEAGVHVLRPEGMDGVEVRRWREGEHLLWDYGPMFTARLERVT